MRDVSAAFERARKLLQHSDATRTVTGRVRFGLQRVQPRVSVLDRGDGKSTLQGQTFADDVWGVGARTGSDELIAALEAVAGGS